MQCGTRRTISPLTPSDLRERSSLPEHLDANPITPGSPARCGEAVGHHTEATRTETLPFNTRGTPAGMTSPPGNNPGPAIVYGKYQTLYKRRSGGFASGLSARGSHSIHVAGDLLRNELLVALTKTELKCHAGVHAS